MSERELVVLDVKPGGAMESQSGLMQKWPRIYCALAPAADRKAAAIVVHPTSNFMGHYLMPHLPAAGVSLLGLNTRYVGNDTMLLFERVIQDLGAGVRYLRDEGYERGDISEWARRIAEHASDCEDVFVYFKHEKAGRGAEFARMLGQDLSAT